MNLSATIATTADVSAIATVRALAGQELTRRHGVGHWSSCVTEEGVLRGFSAPPHTSRVLLARQDNTIVGTLRLATKKPWAIALAYFKPVKRALYLHDMAVTPNRQQQGVGRWLIREAIAVAKTWPAEAIRLDAYDAAAGAGPFYAKCGFTEVGRVTYRRTPVIHYELVF